MTSKSLRLLVLLPLFFVLFITAGLLAAAPAPALPNPVLYLDGNRTLPNGGKQFIRYRYDVFNKDAYPGRFLCGLAEFAAMRKNTKAARTWVDFYDQSGKTA